MPCGCGGSAPTGPPQTSGDLEAAYSAAFRVENDQGVAGFPTYAEAAAFKRENGGRIRTRGS